MFDDDQDLHDSKLCGWWISPSGEISECEEFGFHGPMASSLLADLHDRHGMTHVEEDYDACIADAISLGFIRISTFHGSEAMHLDFDSGRVSRAALRSASRLIGDYRDAFSRYVFEFKDGLPVEFDGGVRKVREFLLKQSSFGPDSVTKEMLVALSASKSDAGEPRL